jgi:Uma2 family endonuclease
MVRALPDDGKRYEVLDGELLVSPAPSLRHQDVLGRLNELIRRYVAKHQLGWIWWSPADVEFAPDRMVQPDLFVVPDTGNGKPAAWRDITALLLVIEALSPHTARRDRGKKRDAYQDEGVPEYWIVDADAELVERWRPADRKPEILREVLVWQPRDGIPSLDIDLREVFAP